MKIPKPLLDDIKMGKCLPFIGAGFSLNCIKPEDVDLPDWKDLSRALAEEAEIQSSVSYPEIASIYEKKFGRVQLIEKIRQNLYADTIQPGAVHLKFASITFETVYTTNFDLLLEDAYQDIKKSYRSLVGELQLPFHGGPMMTNIVKMHGDLRHEEHIVITKEDYDNYLEKYPVIATHLSAMFITKTVLFLGYSLSDPNFQHIREVIRSRLGKFDRMAYIIQFDASDKDIKNMLKYKLHTINLKTTKRKNRTKILIEFFNQIQTYIQSQEVVRIRDQHPEAFEPLEENTLNKAFKLKDSASFLASSSNLCFVIMPLKSKDIIYDMVIKPVTEKFGLKVLRADDIYSPGVVIEQIKAAIYQSRICIADITGMNPNVLYEVGIAHSIGKPTILLSEELEHIPFDLSSFKIIIYEKEPIGVIKIRLSDALKDILGSGRFAKAEKYLQQGNAMATIFEGSVYLEQALRELVFRNMEVLKNQFRGKEAERLSMGQILKLLNKTKIISKRDYNKLQECLNIRNKTVHALTKPSTQDASYFIKLASYFVDKYLGIYTTD